MQFLWLTAITSKQTAQILMCLHVEATGELVPRRTKVPSVCHFKDIVAAHQIFHAVDRRAGELLGPMPADERQQVDGDFRGHRTEPHVRAVVMTAGRHGGLAPTRRPQDTHDGDLHRMTERQSAERALGVQEIGRSGHIPGDGDITMCLQRLHLPFRQVRRQCAAIGSHDVV
ncbi:hypothetical protein DQ384_36680 [Sphaerisporangium album]|uniref:Uncharacterized protein n=1 Tax=Sphaerisporangium album TaxID=509200 RepID=A0A367EU04_9ACTN|nr:hypothetical protein DQ384_36680 [Sphaerisporangium album]